MGCPSGHRRLQWLVLLLPNVLSAGILLAGFLVCSATLPASASGDSPGVQVIELRERHHAHAK